MNYAKKSSIASVLFLQSLSLSASPVDGFYGGIFLGASYMPSAIISFARPYTNNVNQSGELSYSYYGDIGGQIGYRICNFRLEGELVFDTNPYDELTYNNTRILSPKTSTILRLKGRTTVGALMLNGFYDFMQSGADVTFAPYVGLGIGYASAQNNLDFYYNDKNIAGGFSKQTNSAAAGQGILGISYFLDDYTAFSLDYRYFATKEMTLFNRSTDFQAINLVFNGSFDL